MAIDHLKSHPVTGTTDHDLTGLNAGQLLGVDNAYSTIQSTGIYGQGGSLTATTVTATTVTASFLQSGGTDLYKIFQVSTHIKIQIKMKRSNFNMISRKAAKRGSKTFHFFKKWNVYQKPANE